MRASTCSACRRARHEARGLTRVPALGPRGEGWFDLQVVLLWPSLPRLSVGRRQLTRPWRCWGRRRRPRRFAALASAPWHSRAAPVNERPCRGRSPAAVLVEHGPILARPPPDLSGVMLSGSDLAEHRLGVLAGAGLLTVALAMCFDLKARREEAWLARALSGVRGLRAAHQEIRSRPVLRRR